MVNQNIIIGVSVAVGAVGAVVAVIFIYYKKKNNNSKYVAMFDNTNNIFITEDVL
jgi:hypothetical protein